MPEHSVVLARYRLYEHIVLNTDCLDTAASWYSSSQFYNCTMFLFRFSHSITQIVQYVNQVIVDLLVIVAPSVLVVTEVQ
jgi:mannose-1-phosphate guanylyltransferase